MSRALLLAVAAAVAIAGCAHRKSPPPQPTASCRLNTLRPLVGRPGSAVLAAEALAQSGARVVRWVRPGQPMTKDYLQDRLNIRVSRDDIVKAFSCG